MIRTAILLAVSALSLAGCGLKGDLERPAPLWGNPPNEGANDPRTIKQREEEAARKKAEQEAAQAAARDATQSQPTVPMPGAPQ